MQEALDFRIEAEAIVDAAMSVNNYCNGCPK